MKEKTKPNCTTKYSFFYKHNIRVEKYNFGWACARATLTSMLKAGDVKEETENEWMGKSYFWMRVAAASQNIIQLNYYWIVS